MQLNKNKITVESMDAIRFYGVRQNYERLQSVQDDSDMNVLTIISQQ